MLPKEVARYLRKSVSWDYRNWKVLGNVKLGGSLVSLERRNSMSTYFIKGKGWRFDFTLRGNRFTSK